MFKGYILNAFGVFLFEIELFHDLFTKKRSTIFTGKGFHIFKLKGANSQFRQEDFKTINGTAVAGYYFFLTESFVVDVVGIQSVDIKSQKLRLRVNHEKYDFSTFSQTSRGIKIFTKAHDFYLRDIVLGVVVVVFLFHSIGKLKPFLPGFWETVVVMSNDS